ncbi:MAG TPA: hypothetical protein VFM99_11335 [Chitinophagales bacterium]|nr:hypothetical protein [Chitinophagales bacterium]
MHQQQNNNLTIYISYILSIFLGSCNDPYIILVPGNGQGAADCYFPEAEKITGYDYVFDSVSYERPYFNPNNPDEFIYLENGDLYKYTISSLEKSLLYAPDHYIYFQPKWSRKGIIAFNTSDYNIWIMKDNGDSLTQITNTGTDTSVNFYGEFNYTGDSLMFETSGYYSDSDTRKIRIAFNNFTEFDTIFSPELSASGANWQKPGHLIYLTYDCMNLSGIYNSELSNKVCYSDTLFSTGGSTIWLENKVDFYCYGNGVFTGNFETNSLTKVKDMCPYIYYLFPCYSEVSGKVITSKITKEYLGDNKVHVSTEIIIMNPDGSDEQIILPKPE